MERKMYDHNKLEGTDADLETSLKEYGMAWIETETEFLFYYGILENEQEYTRFDFCSFGKWMNFEEEFNWISPKDWKELEQYTGVKFKDMPFQHKIFDLYKYHGYLNIFGSTYWEGLTYSEIVKASMHE